MSILYICIVVFSVMQVATTKFFTKHSDNSYVFNALKALFALILMLIINVSNMDFDKTTTVYALCYGASLCISMYCGYKALCLGPLSLTSLISAFSVIIPILYGIICFGETITTFKIMGICFLILAIILINIKKSNHSGNKANTKWAIFISLTFITNGLCSVIQTKHQRIYPGEHTSDFMIIAMLLCAVVYLTVALTQIPIKDLWKTKGKRYGIMSGASNALANYITLKLAGMENASIMFPIISAGTIFTTVLCGTVMFKEHLKFNHVVAIICGIAAIVFLKL